MSETQLLRRQPSAAAAPTAVLRRACACGGSAGLDGECRGCRAKRLQRAAAPGGAVAPRIVHTVLGQPGRPLDAPTRDRMESRLRHDFAAVRIHDDATAKASAQAVDAFAYTVGNHVVLGNRSNDQLLAHELAHVVQQHGASPAGGELRIGSEHDPAEREAEAAARGSRRLSPVPATRLTRQRAPHVPAPPTQTPSAGASGQAPAAHTSPPAAPPSHCLPGRPLKWSDYPVRSHGSFAAMTAFTGRVRGSGGSAYYEVGFQRSNSWVLPLYVHPTDRRRNGCAPLVASCHRGFAPGFTWSYVPGTGCAASIQPTAAPTTAAECETVFGVACDRAATAESARLLAHEQGHLDLACAVGAKATAALASGATPHTVDTAFARLTGPGKTSLTSRYDADTDHGCKAPEQAAWLQMIATGLPNVQVP